MSVQFINKLPLFYKDNFGFLVQLSTNKQSETVLSLKTTPMYLTKKGWEADEKGIKEHEIELEEQKFKKLIFFTQNKYDFMQFQGSIFSFFWNREVLSLSCIQNKHGEYQLYLFNRYWNGETAFEYPEMYHVLEVWPKRKIKRKSDFIIHLNSGIVEKRYLTKEIKKQKCKEFWFGWRIRRSN